MLSDLTVTMNDNEEPSATDGCWRSLIIELSFLVRQRTSSTLTASSGIPRASNTLRTIVLGKSVTEAGIPEILISGDITGLNRRQARR